MSEFKILQVSNGKWVIKAPKRAKRPDQANGEEPACPFEGDIKDKIFSLNEVTVKKNKYPFAEVHEVIIHSKDHHKNFDELPLSNAVDIFKVFQARFLEHKDKGQVYIFHNHGENAGESLPHPHTQLAVVPAEVKLDLPPLKLGTEEVKETPYFYIYCPDNSQWPDEVWIAPKREGKSFDETDETEIEDLAFIVSRLVQIFDLRHGHEFPFNFYIYPGVGWYLRLIPRLKTLGGFEIGTGVYINTQDSSETFAFIKEHFDNPDFEKIRSAHQADYTRSA